MHHASWVGIMGRNACGGGKAGRTSHPPPGCTCAARLSHHHGCLLPPSLQVWHLPAPAQQAAHKLQGERHLLADHPGGTIHTLAHHALFPPPLLPWQQGLLAQAAQQLKRSRVCLLC